jgi:molecular chaperone DnaK (HSP70)
VTKFEKFFESSKNTLSGLIHAIDKALKEHSDKIEATAKKRVEDALALAREKLNGTEAVVVLKATGMLTDVANKLAEHIKHKIADSHTGAPRTSDSDLKGT